jgi:hypothetical protein
MNYKVTFYTNRVQKLPLLDGHQWTPCLVTRAKRSPISRGRVMDCEKRCKRYLNPSR